MLPFIFAWLVLIPCGFCDEVLQIYDAESEFIIEKDDLGNLTSLDLYMLRPEQLSNLSGSDLAALGLVNAQNAALFEKSVLACAKKRQRAEFLKAMQGNLDLSEAVQEVLAEIMPVWYPDMENQWKFELFRRALETGSPVLAYLPRSFLYNMEIKQQQKFLYHLQQWTWPTSRSLEWSKKSPSLKRVWAEMLDSGDATRLHQFSPQRLQFINFILTGSTPDELSKIKLKSTDAQKLIFNLPLDPMQIRAVFASTHHSQRPNSDLLEMSLPLLTPTQIASLAHRNLSHVAREAFERNERHPVSWASAAQLAHLLVQEANRDSAVWDEKTLTNVGKWIFALPTSYLYQAARVIEALPEDKKARALAAIGSAQLSSKQARILVGEHFSNPSTTLENALVPSSNLLLIIPSVKIDQREILPQSVITHLLSNLPPQSTALFILYDRTKNLIGKKWLLEAMLNGEQEPNRFAHLMKSEDIKPMALELSKIIRTSRHQKGWPRSFLRLVAHHSRSNMTDLDEWAHFLLHNPKLIMGLTCSDLLELGRNHGLPILALLGQHLQTTNQWYPKDLSKCALKPLLSYLKHRAESQQIDTEVLLDTLHKAEIMSIGGNPLVYLPYSAIKTTKNWATIVQSIGRLSIIELLEVFVLPGSTPQLLSQISLRLNNKKAILHEMGNLFQFLPFADELHANLDSRAFRLWLEGKDRKSDTALCVTRGMRASLWYKIIVDAYGPPSEWSAGTLTTLAGLLLAVPPQQLNEVEPLAFQEAADQLDSSMGYTPEFMRLCSRYLGPDEASPFEQSVKALLSFVLNTTNNLAASVASKMESKQKKRKEEPITISIPKIRKLNGNVFNISAKIYPSIRNKRATDSLTQTEGQSNRETTTQHPISKLSPAKYRQNSSMLIESAAGKNKIEPVKEKMLCGSLKMAKHATIVSLDEQHLKMLDAAGDFAECLPYLGSIDLSALAIRQIWEYIKYKNLTVDVRDIGILTSQVDVEILRASDLTDMDVVSAVGSNLQSWEQLNEIADMILEANENNLTSKLAGNMGRLLCANNIWEQNLISSTLFAELYHVLAHLLTTSHRCPPLDCLKRIIKHGESSKMFGPINDLHGDLVYSLGTVMAGLSPANLRSFNEFESLHPGALRCLRSDSLKTFNDTHFSKLSFSSLETVFIYRYGELSLLQQSQLRRALVSSPAHSLLTSINYDIVEFQKGNANLSSAATTGSTFSLVLITSLHLALVYFFN